MTTDTQTENGEGHQPDPIAEKLQSQSHTDTAFTLGQLHGIIVSLGHASRYAASSDLRSRVQVGCANAEAIFAAYQERSNARLLAAQEDKP